MEFCYEGGHRVGLYACVLALSTLASVVFVASFLAFVAYLLAYLAAFVAFLRTFCVRYFRCVKQQFRHSS